MNLLLAAVLLAQGMTAEETLQRIEDTFLKARSVSVSSRAEARLTRDGKEETLDVSAALLLKEGNRSRVLTSRVLPNRDTECMTLVSDGRRARVSTEKSTEESDVAGNHNELQIRRFVRLGLAASSVCLCQIQEAYAYALEDLKAGESPEGEAVLTYKLKTSPIVSEVTLWYDPKRFTPTRHVIRLKSATLQGTLTDRIQNVVFDGDIPDEKFRLGPAAVDEATDRKKIERAKIILAEVSIAIDLFRLDYGSYPASVKDLVNRPKDIDPKRWPPGGYLLKVPTDAWGHDLVYRVPGTNGHAYDLLSLGADGKEGGEGSAADLWNHEVNKKK